MVEHTTENRGVPGSSPGLAIADPGFVATLAEPAPQADVLAPGPSRRSLRLLDEQGDLPRDDLSVGVTLDAH